MKKLDLVKLKNDRPYKLHNLNRGMHGIVVDVNFDNADVLFLIHTMSEIIQLLM